MKDAIAAAAGEGGAKASITRRHTVRCQKVMQYWRRWLQRRGMQSIV